MTLDDYAFKIHSSMGKVKLLETQITEAEDSIERYGNKLVDIENAQAFIQKVAKSTQEQLKFHIEDVVQLALDSIFPDEYKFSIEFIIKYGATAANLIFMKNGYPVDILKQAGGGVVDIASLALRIAVWSLSKSDNVLILDEPIARIQPATLQAVAWDVIKELSRRLKLQFIIISNSTNNGEAVHLLADKEFKVTKSTVEIKEEEWDISSIEEI